MAFKKIFTVVLLTFVFFASRAQQKVISYDAAWRNIDTLIVKKGLPESALAEVNKLYNRAKMEKNDGQLIKALLYKLSLAELKEEDADKKNIQQLEKELATAKEPARNIIASILAETYWSWFQQKRWQLYNRTATINFVKEDVATWGAEDFYKRITELNLESLSNEKLLQQTKLEPFDPIIIKGNMRHLRPTLFDLLAHRALQFFKSGETNVTKPAYSFEINDSTAFADAKTFMTHPFVTQDSLSLYYKALQLYQRLLRFHTNDAKPDALLDADIDRLEFVYQHATTTNKEEQYKVALEKIINSYGSVPAAAQASYLLASWYSTKAGRYEQTKNETDRLAYLEAKKICDRIIAQPSESEGKANCQNLLMHIQQQELQVETEKVNIPGKPFRALVSYRNFAQVHFRIIKVDAQLKESLGTNTWEDSYWKNILLVPVYKTFSQTIPDTKDYQKHTVEIKVDSLPYGQYALISSTNNDFSIDYLNAMAVQFFYVSNIAYINRNNEYFVVNRETGAPLARASVQAWYRYYNSGSRKYETRKGENVMTDKNGYFKIFPAQTNTESNYKLEITTIGDRLFLDDYTYNAYLPPTKSMQKPETERMTFMFTDRAIYRPGQTVYVKGILVSRNTINKKSDIVADFATTVFLYDMNGQKADSLNVTTNEYGSWSGKFTLPSNLLNGQFSITDPKTNSQVYIRVEEYKRPRFITEIAKPSGTYKLNDSITVTGTAKAYAGNAIDGAQVKYRVVRRMIIPYWIYGSRSYKIWPPYQREEVEIAHGETVTDAKGEFTIRFKALPDNSVDKKDQPTFTYEVSADVTDIAGETRSGNTSVAVSYQAIKLNMNVPARILADSLKNIVINSTNMNDLFEKTTVTLSIYKLNAPNRIFRERYWQQPDQFIFSEEEYHRLFPYDIYKDENLPATWSKSGKVAEITDTTSANSKFSVQKTDLIPGWYAFEAIAKDKFGEEVKAISYVEVYTPANSVNPVAFGDIESDKAVYEPSEKINYRLRTNLDSVFIIHEVLKKDSAENRSFVWLNKNSSSFEIPVTESERGGVGVYISFVKHNRFYTSDQTFTVPYTNKELSIAYETFRDKTLPGSQEKWKVKISGYKKDKVAAELLTGMYDASLDQFAENTWPTPSIYDYLFRTNNWQGLVNFASVNAEEKRNYPPTVSFDKRYDIIGIDNYNEWTGGGRPRHMKLPKAAPMAANQSVRIRGVATESADAENMNYKKGDAMAYAESNADGVADAPDTVPPKQEAPAVQIRKNFNETAFFFPDLKTDSNGVIEFSFTMPEAVTQWKWMSLAHTKDLAFGYSEKTVITQKELMVQPNAPRFLREGDRMDFSGKIANLTTKEITGQVQLQFFDPTTNQPIDGWFRNMFPNQFFTVAAGQTTPVSFTIEVPFQYNRPVTYRLIASEKSGMSDGEEAILPVVSNRMLVTESMPLPVKGTAAKSFKFDKLLQSGNSETLNHHAITVEFTTNPTWYAVQALPYLMEYPYECAEQIFNRYYANALATTIANASPKVKEIFNRWKNSDSSALLSNLQKNEELKSVLLQETPWVLQAKSEAEQKKNIALLFDMIRMSNELSASIGKLSGMQLDNGGFPWFQDGPDDRFITQYILTGIGHLKKLNALPKNNAPLQAIINKAIPYLDARFKEDYDNLLKRNKQQLPATGELTYMQIQYLYMRSFFPDIALPGTISKAYNYYRKQSQLKWLQQNKYLQGMIALSLQRTGDTEGAKKIVASLKQNAIVHPELGMYWKDMTGGYYWYQAPIETQSVLIETFTEVMKDTKSVDDMKTWLLKQKQTHNWKTTKATADACYALLLQGTEWLTNTPDVTIQLGDLKINSADQPQEAGTGYFKKVIEGTAVKPAMGDIQVFIKSEDAKTNGRPAWGAVYWQYFENLDKITPSATPLKLTKKLFIEKNTDRGPVLQPVNENDALHVGDKIKVRIELRTDRELEYVHMKDMRAACMEPVNVLSSFKWQGGLGYYETTKDASTNFFFNRLPKGTFVFEYALFVTHTGTFSNGVTTIQCMYAPEFTSNSEGIKVNVEQ